MRIGQGVDIHAFEEGAHRPLRIGGVEIPDGPPLAGHSDADVVLHALVDAVLGAAGAGDLGLLVGVDRPEIAGADSAGFVRQARDLAAERALVVGNIDLTVIAQRPRIAPHRRRIVARIADLLEVDEGAVSVKATTTDHLGFIGRGEGVACLAVVLLVPSGDGGPVRQPR